VLASAVGCGDEANRSDTASLIGSSEETPASEPGWLVTDWTIAGQKDVAGCDLSHSATVALSVAAASTAAKDLHQHPCGSFNATVMLTPGDYTAEAQLLDGAGTPLTVPVALEPFEISSGTPTRIPFAFPTSAFY